MSRRISWQAVAGNIIGAAVIMVIVFAVPQFIFSSMASGAVRWVPREMVITAGVAVFGAAIATRHWLAPTLLAIAFLLLPILGLLPVKSAQGSHLFLAGVTALAILFTVVGLLLASLVLIVGGVIRGLPPRS